MKTTVIAIFRTAALASALLLAPALAAAKSKAAGDPAAELLATAGIVAVKAAGPYVEIGSFRIQVSAKLGQPSATLVDGTWLYRGFAVDESAATGTLVVRFNRGQVSELSLVTPTIATAMLHAARPPDAIVLVAQANK